MRAANITLNVYAIIVMGVLCTVCILQRAQNKQINNSLIGWMVAHILMLAFDTAKWYLRGKIDNVALFTGMFFAEYICGYICLIFFHYYFTGYISEHTPVSKKVQLAVWPVSIVMCILWIASYKNRLFYVITYNAVNVSSDWYYLSQVPALLVVILDTSLVLRNMNKIGRRNALALCLSLSFLLIAFPMQLAWNAEVLFIGVTLSLLSRYTTISSEQNRLLAESRIRLAESRIAITMSQIQPHFLYNALGSISVLCDIDPKRARDATDHFAEYLRMNLESMKQIYPVPFQTELNHVETYLWIEKMRFGEKLRIKYDIQAKDFLIPALSVQPIVENAVKHGVCMKEHGGTIVISTHKTDDGYYIGISDDGIGFTWKEAMEYGDKKLHIGIKNVMNRLEAMVNGSLCIQSEPGKGTAVTIYIPKLQTETV